MSNTYKGIDKQVDSQGNPHTVNVYDGANMMPMDVAEYVSKGIKPDLKDLPVKAEEQNNSSESAGGSETK